MKIVHELKCIIFGTQNGWIKIFTWPFNEYNENTKLKSNLIYEISLHTGPVIDITLTNSLKYIITASSDGSIFYSEILVNLSGFYKGYNLLLDHDKFKPKIDIFLGINEINQYKISEVRNNEQISKVLNKKKKILEKHNKEHGESKMGDHEREIKNLEDQVNIKLNSIEKRIFNRRK